MKIYNFKDRIDEKELNEIACAIKNRKLIVFPTETVYGIGANALDSKAIAKIFKAKGRPSDNPLIVHVSDKDMIKDIVRNINEIEQELIDKFMPGPITIILPKSDIIPDNVTCSLDTVGIRIPENEIARKIIKKAGVPIAAPSANISGKPSGTNIEDIKKELNNKVDYIVDGGTCKIGLESTVVKVQNGVVRILRPGKISPDDIVKLGLKVELDLHIFNDVKAGEMVESPGMKHRHYAPEANAVLVEFDLNNMIDSIKKIVYDNKDSYKKIAIVGFNEHSSFFESLDNIEFISFGSINNLDEVSSNIFKVLRELDNKNIDFCIIEGVKKEGIGIAIMNRLLRACSYNMKTGL